jgi:hypothetical protein
LLAFEHRMPQLRGRRLAFPLTIHTESWGADSDWRLVHWKQTRKTELDCSRLETLKPQLLWKVLLLLQELYKSKDQSPRPVEVQTWRGASTSRDHLGHPTSQVYART